MLINNGRVLDKANYGNQWGHNYQLVSYVFIIFIQVVNDATPWPTALGKNLYYKKLLYNQFLISNYLSIAFRRFFWVSGSLKHMHSADKIYIYLVANRIILVVPQMKWDRR